LATRQRCVERGGSFAPHRTKLCLDNRLPILVFNFKVNEIADKKAAEIMET
jgi:hypothetical protein